MFKWIYGIYVFLSACVYLFSLFLGAGGLNYDLPTRRPPILIEVKEDGNYVGTFYCLRGISASLPASWWVCDLKQHLYGV